MPDADTDSQEHPFPWQHGVFDAHCHPTDTMVSIDSIPTMNATAFTIMATRAQDQELVDTVAKDQGLSVDTVQHGVPRDWRGIIPSFGWHPWFSHQMFDDSRPGFAGSKHLSREQKHEHYSLALTPVPQDPAFLDALPDPRPLSVFMHETRARLEQHPSALIGEVGLDKGFRIPEAWLPSQQGDRDESLTPGGREGRRLSPYRVNMEHQKTVLLAQLRLAGEQRRAVSCHGVQAHGLLFETIRETWKGHEKPVLSQKERKRQAQNSDRLYSDDAADSLDSTQTVPPYPPRLCLHSYSGPPDPILQYTHPSVPVDVFFSFSLAINFSTPAAAKTEAVIKAVPDHRILVESDLHTAGEDMDRHLEGIVRKVCELKGWPLEAGMKRMRENWQRFIFGIASSDESPA